jgi:hypothetical protein
MTIARSRVRCHRHWLAGFVDGEGNFDIHAVGRSYIQAALKMGDVSFIQAKGGNTGGQVRYVIARKAECAALIPIFDRFPLRAKKARDLILWREAVSLWMQVRSKQRHDWTAMGALRDELRQGRKIDAEPAEARPRSPQLKLVA